MKARDNPKAVQIEVRSTFGNLKQDVSQSLVHKIMLSTY